MICNLARVAQWLATCAGKKRIPVRNCSLVLCRVDLSPVITWLTFNALVVCGSGREGLKLASSFSFCPVICVCLVKENPDIWLWAHKNTPKLKVYLIVFLKPLRKITKTFYFKQKRSHDNGRDSRADSWYIITY